MMRIGDPVARVLATLGEDGPLDYTALRQRTGLDGLDVVKALEHLERDGRVTAEREGEQTVWLRAVRDLGDAFSEPAHEVTDRVLS